MANLFENKDRRVVPNWRSFGKTTALGELNSPTIEKKTTPRLISIEEYVEDWNNNKNISYAADLLSAALVNNKKNDPSIIEAANLILSNRQTSTKSQVSLAHKILNNEKEEDWLIKFDEISSETLLSLVNPLPIRERIKNNKRQLKAYPRNAILYVELSRYYSILGQEDSAISAMKSAIFLAPNNRFVLRCAVRLFIHYDNESNNYIDYIHEVLRKSPAINNDPWLISAEISIATIRNRTSRFIKKGLELIESKTISPLSYTELASGIGTLELINGSHKKSKLLFSKSLISPNDNSLAQIEWASTKDKTIEVNPHEFKVKMNFEALALENYHNNQYKEALDFAAKWFIDMPFSKRPIMLASNLASTVLKDQDVAISFLKAGLASHPNDAQLINNLAYSLALQNKAEDAINELSNLKSISHYDEATQICLTATRGLTLFRSGEIQEGRRLYLEAIEKTQKIKNKELNWIAILNYAREEILIGEHINEVMEAVSKVPSNYNKEIDILKQDIIELYHKKLNR